MEECGVPAWWEGLVAQGLHRGARGERSTEPGWETWSSFSSTRKSPSFPVSAGLECTHEMSSCEGGALGCPSPVSAPCGTQGRACFAVWQSCSDPAETSSCVTRAVMLPPFTAAFLPFLFLKISHECWTGASFMEMQLF